MGFIGKQVFISYRGSYYKQAMLLKDALVQHGYCNQAILFPPNSLCAENEILLPYEYVELMEFILDYLAHTDTFIYLETSDYWNSYFTQAEALQWRRFRDVPVVHSAQVDWRGQIFLGEQMRWETLNKSQKKLWASISVSINRSMGRGHLMPPTAWGRFAKHCFLLPCGVCGEHFLVSQKAIYRALKNLFEVECPHCGNNHFRFSELPKRGNYYRKPIIVQQHYYANLRVLGSFEILKLLIENNEMSAFPLVTLPGEHLDSDIAKIGKFYLALGVAAAAIGILSNIPQRDNQS